MQPVLSEMRNPDPLLRFRACSTYRQFQVEKTHETKLSNETFCQIVDLCNDDEQAIRKRAEFIFRDLKLDQIRSVIFSNIPHLLKTIFNVVVEVRNKSRKTIFNILFVV